MTFTLFVARITHLFLSVLLSLWPVWVTRDVAELYKVQFILDFSFAQWFCIYCIATLITAKRSKKEDDDHDDESKLAKDFIRLIEAFLIVLVWWGLMYVVHFFVQ